MTCSSCAQPLPEGARFCPSCGTPQFTGRDAPGDEERRVVSVLFADLVGFTALSEHRDPERVKRMIDEVFEQLLGVIETHGGVVDKVLGDAIIALFGAPIAHEDDADRAVRAGLAMQDVLRVFRQQHPDDPIELRVGVNTGEVLVGTVAGTDYTAMGDVVNTAARLQQLAVAGSVYIGDPTRQLASPAIRFRALDAVRLRGRTQDTRVWEALEVVSSPTSRHWVSDVPFVGRTTELSMLRSVASIVASERSAIVAVSGEAGIGKSRLVHEAVEAFVRDHPTTLVIEGSCAPYGESNVWWPVAGALLTRLGFDRGGTPDEVRRRVTRRLRGVELFEAGSSKHTRMVELVLHLLGQPSGLDALGPIATRDAVFAGMVAALQRRTVHGPVVVWVDDVQWAAPLLLELLESVARQVVSSPVLIITTHRPDEQSPLTWPPASDPALTLHLSLEALDDAESARLVGYASGRDLPPDVVERVSSRSGGNPLFLIELARLAGGDATDSDDLPGSLRALIASRLDQLSPSQRSMLDNAAVLGNSGRITSLRNFSAALGQHYDVDDIAVLHDSGLLVVDGQHWRFRSDVVREVAYHTLTKLARAQRHAGIVRHLMEFEPSEIDRIAHHAASAAELRDELGPIVAVPDDIARLAVSCLMESARRWFDQGAHRFGLQLIERALALPEQAPAEHRALLLLQVEALVESHDLAEARSLIADLAKRSEEAG
ncbi:MAG: adenylate/guanylate cyclase domain-containing protein, partial [Ilumatobacteraceae bacterium]